MKSKLVIWNDVIIYDDAVPPAARAEELSRSQLIS